MSIDHRAIIENPDLIRSFCTIHPLAVLLGQVILARGSVVMPLAVVGKPTAGRHVLSRTPDAPQARDGQTIVGENSVIDAHAVIYAGARIGKNSLIGAHATVRENAVIGSGCTIGHYANISHDVLVSDGVRVMDHATLIGGTVVGEGSFIGPHVSMANDGDPEAIVAGTWSEKRFNPPHIGKRVFIGCGAIILAGVHIGDEAMIYAGAVVTKDVRPGDTVLGLPARPKPAANDGFAPIARFTPEDVSGDFTVSGHPV